MDGQIRVQDSSQCNMPQNVLKGGMSSCSSGETITNQALENQSQLKALY